MVQFITWYCLAGVVFTSTVLSVMDELSTYSSRYTVHLDNYHWSVQLIVLLLAVILWPYFWFRYFIWRL
jgi:hypothetical protein